MNVDLSSVTHSEELHISEGCETVPELGLIDQRYSRNYNSVATLRGQLSLLLSVNRLRQSFLSDSSWLRYLLSCLS